MAALVCDLCGGKLVMGSGGVAVCDSCGMEHSPDRMKEKIQEIKGVVRVDNTHMIDNYLEMANNAFNAGNNAEAESYCNKVIEIEPTNYRAWFLKGKAAGWQSTLQNSRISESVAAFSKAINNAPEEERELIIEDSKEQVIRLATAILSLRGERFAKWPDESEKEGFSSDISSVLNALLQFVSQASIVIPLSELMAPIATIINESVVNAYQNVVFPEYNGDPSDRDDRPRDYDWRKYIDRVSYCTDLLEKSINLCDEDDEADIQRYENLIYLHKQAIDSCSWDYEITSFGKIWNKRLMLSDAAIDFRRKLIRQYQGKIEEIKEAKDKKDKQEAEERLAKYWNEHADEKNMLENEKRNLKSQIADLNKERTTVYNSAEKKNIEDSIKTLIDEKNSLGLLKMKEKKAIQEKIDAANEELKNITKKIDDLIAEIDKRIQPLEARMKEINNELTKAR